MIQEFIIIASSIFVRHKLLGDLKCYHFVVIFYFILKKFGLIFLIKQNKNPTHPPKKN
jgi:hypothetical protein